MKVTAGTMYEALERPEKKSKMMVGFKVCISNAINIQCSFLYKLSIISSFRSCSRCFCWCEHPCSLNGKILGNQTFELSVPTLVETGLLQHCTYIHVERVMLG